jgi:hypothetical protein
MPSALTPLYQERMKQTREAAAASVRRTWKSLPSYNDTDVAPFFKKIEPVMLAYQHKAVAISAAYMSKLLKVPPIALDPSKLAGASASKDMTPQEVYRVPFTSTWRALSDGADYEDAVNQGENSAAGLSQMDVALAASAALYAVGERAGSFIIGWIRVADNGACKFCTDVDGSRTGPDQPAPLHECCGCSVEPITGHTT